MIFPVVLGGKVSQAVQDHLRFLPGGPPSGTTIPPLIFFIAPLRIFLTALLGIELSLGIARRESPVARLIMTGRLNYFLFR
jgi:hypothetical protein